MYDIIIVGGSAAGLTSALYTSRQGMNTLVITKDIGGQMLLTNEIQNYPGFHSISGFELATKLKEQAESYGANFVYDEVTGLEEDKDCPGMCFKVKTLQDTFNALSVILAFGKTPMDLGVPGEQELKGRGVSYCAVCDGPLFRGKVVSVIGSGEQALDAVNYLSSVAKSVYFIHNYDRPIGSEEMVQQILSLPNVQRVPNSRVKELIGDTKLRKIVTQNTKDHSLTEIESDAIFIEIGYIAKTDFLRGLVELNDKGEVKVDKECKTSHHGIFAAGDVTDIAFKQAVISAAEGAVAALSAYNYVQRIKGKTAIRNDWRSIQPKKKSDNLLKI